MSFPVKKDFVFGEFTDTDWQHDPDFIRLRSPFTHLHLLGDALPEMPRDETVLYLNSFAKKHFEMQAHVASPVCFRNDSDFAILHFSILSTRAQKEVFRLNLLRPKKNIQLEFVQEGRYNFCYWISGAKKKESKTVHLTARPRNITRPPHNFSLPPQRF